MSGVSAVVAVLAVVLVVAVVSVSVLILCVLLIAVVGFSAFFLSVVSVFPSYISSLNILWCRLFLFHFLPFYLYLSSSLKFLDYHLPSFFPFLGVFFSVSFNLFIRSVSFWFVLSVSSSSFLSVLGMLMICTFHHNICHLIVFCMDLH